jgi:hypothetical protein
MDRLFDLEGWVAVVTGGTGVLGAGSIAHRFATGACERLSVVPSGALSGRGSGRGEPRSRRRCPLALAVRRPGPGCP